jgi:peptidoglycan-associated lipoprotein
MSLETKLRSAALMVAVAALAVGCSSGPKATTAPPTEAAPVTTSPPTREVPEQVVSEPRAEAIPSEEVREELPDDIQELNRRGYLQDVFFDTNRHELRDDGREALAANAAWLQRFPSVSIVVEGHCDERNTREYNLALGERRASTVRDYLVSLGVPAERIRIISYGEERPFAAGNDESAWRLNRRAHFVITSR